MSKDSVVVPLSRAPYPQEFFDAINGYATGGSGRCRESIEAEGAWIAAPQPADLRERVRLAIWQNVDAELVGTTEDHAEVVGIDEATDAVLALLQPSPVEQKDV